MKLTNREIINSLNVLNILSNRQFPIKVSYAISKNIYNINKEIEVYNLEKGKVIDKYCKKDENGELIIDENNNYSIQEGNENVCNKTLNELLDIEVELDIHRFKLDDLLHGNYEMSPLEIGLIDYMIE